MYTSELWIIAVITAIQVDSTSEGAYDDVQHITVPTVTVPDQTNGEAVKNKKDPSVCSYSSKIVESDYVS